MSSVQFIKISNASKTPEGTSTCKDETNSRIIDNKFIFQDI